MRNVDEVKQVEDGVAYHVFFKKNKDYVMKLMTTYGTLEPTNKRTRGTFKCSGATETKDFMHAEVVKSHFLYQNQVGDNNNRRQTPIYIEKTWATKYWPDCCFAWYLAVSQVNAKYTRA